MEKRKPGRRKEACARGRGRCGDLEGPCVRCGTPATRKLPNDFNILAREQEHDEANAVRWLIETPDEGKTLV